MARPPSRPRFAPIPQRIPPLTWRRPFYLWTPAALLLAIGWPALLLRGQSVVFQASLATAAFACCVVVVVLIGGALMKRPPRARRTVIRAMVWAGVAAAIASPFIVTSVIDEQSGVSGAVLAITPLALLLGLPVALFSGIVFSLVALVKPKAEMETQARVIRVTDVSVPEHARDVQPFY